MYSGGVACYKHVTPKEFAAVWGPTCEISIQRNLSLGRGSILASASEPFDFPETGKQVPLSTRESTKSEMSAGFGI